MSDHFEDEDDIEKCSMCPAADPPIFLCGEGWWCEDCFRRWSGAAEDLPSDDLHDSINDGDTLGLAATLRQNLYAETE